MITPLSIFAAWLAAAASAAELAALEYRRMERALDEIAADAQDDARLQEMYSPPAARPMRVPGGAQVIALAERRRQPRMRPLDADGELPPCA